MKKKAILFFVLIVTIVFFTGCEQSVNIPEAFSEIKGYNSESITTIMNDLKTHGTTYYTEGTFGEIEDGITYYVDENYTSEIDLSVNLDNWVASDGTKLSGYIDLEIYFDNTTGAITDLDTENNLYYDTTITYFETKTYNESSDAGEFSIGFISYQFLTLSIDGESVMSLFGF
jgi:outer membrane lipoprotein-sorting protein